MLTELGFRETELLRRLVGAGARHDAEPDEGAVDLARSIDWDVVLAAAERHRLSPLVLDGIERSGIAAAVPQRARTRLEDVFHLELAKAVVKLHHVDELGEIAASKKLDLCLLKGAAFATTLYSRPGLRPMADVDVLSPASQLARWSHELEALGYACIDTSDHAVCFRRRESGVLVELHRELTSQSSELGLVPEQILERAVPWPSRHESGLRTLSWEDHLLHLTLHASFHHGFRQPAVNAWDARAIVERFDFDLRTFVRAAGDEKLAPWVYGGLAMSEATFGGARLGEARRALEHAVSARVLRKAGGFRGERLLAPAVSTVFGPPVERLLWQGHPLRSLRLLVDLARPRTAGGSRGFCSSLRRVLHLIRHHGIRVIRSFCSERPHLPMGPRPASLGEIRDV